MSSVSEMFPQREQVYIIVNNQLQIVNYNTLSEGDYYIIELLSGSFSIYCKTTLFDDDLLTKVKTGLEAVELIQSLTEND